MKVAVEILTGNFFYVGVKDDATVGELKREIGAQEKLPVDRMILILNPSFQVIINDEDGDKKPLVDFGIKDGSHLYLFFTPPIIDPHQVPSSTTNSPAEQPSPGTATA